MSDTAMEIWSHPTGIIVVPAEKGDANTYRMPVEWSGFDIIFDDSWQSVNIELSTFCNYSTSTDHLN